MKNFLTIVLSILMNVAVFGQTNSLLIPSNVYLPKDTVLKNLLLSSLNGFLSQKEQPNSENTFVLKEDLLETSVLLDEMKDISQSRKFNDSNFYKCYLTNAVKLNDSSMIIQLAYIGINGGEPLTRANFTLEAQKKGNQFYFRSPLKHNTSGWKSQKIGVTTLHYKTTFNAANAKDYFKMVANYDARLKAPNLPTEFYCCENFHEVLQLIGVDYKSDYNSGAHNTLSGKENNTSLIVNGTFTPEFADIDPHDLWHERLHNVLSISIINRPVDEGTAYLYGGSWGLSWQQILEKFKAYAAANPKTDWLAQYNESKNFDERSKYPLNVDFVINALIVQKIEKEKGFSSVLELLSCGKKEKENDNYFKALERIAGISKADFSTKVWALIKGS